MNTKVNKSKTVNVFNLVPHHEYVSSA